MGGSVRLVFSKKINARKNMLPIRKGEQGKERWETKKEGEKEVRKVKGDGLESSEA